MNKTQSKSKVGEKICEICNKPLGAAHACLRKAPWNDPEVRWVCEDHPTEEQGHKIGWWIFSKECGGAGMPEPTEENYKKGYLS